MKLLGSCTTTTDTDAMLLAGGWLALLAGRLVAQLREGGCDDPLSEPLMLAAVLSDLFTLAGTVPPAEIRERVGA